jgi:hypothetical protein
MNLPACTPGIGAGGPIRFPDYTRRYGIDGRTEKHAPTTPGLFKFLRARVARRFQSLDMWMRVGISFSSHGHSGNSISWSPSCLRRRMKYPSDFNRNLVQARLMMSAKVASSMVTPVASMSVYTLSITGVKIRVITEADRLK